jgi:hypothetical protein
VSDLPPQPCFNQTPPETGVLGGFGDAAKIKYSEIVPACDPISRRFIGYILKRSSFESNPEDQKTRSNNLFLLRP